MNPDLATKVAPAEMIAAQTQQETAVEETEIAAPIDHGAIEQEDRINSTEAPTTTTTPQDVKQDGTQSEEEEEEEDPMFENDPELKFVRERLDTIAKYIGIFHFVFDLYV